MKFPIRRISKAYILENQDYVYDGWKNSWDESGWGDDEFFVFDEEIRYLSEIAELGYAYIVEDEQQIIAFAIGTIENFPKPKDDNESEIFRSAYNDFKKPGYFHELAVNPNYRGTGIGSYLIKFIETTLKNAGCYRIMPWTRQESPSKGLYIKNNYNEIARATVPKNNISGSENRVYYTKSLRNN